MIFRWFVNKCIDKPSFIAYTIYRKVVLYMANVNIRMDDATKTQFDAFCNEVGLSVSAVFNMFAKRVVKEQRIPFDITTEVPNAETRAAIREVEYMQKHPELFKSYRDAHEMFEDILNEEV